MYPDQNRVRTNRVTLRLDQYEHELLVALANCLTNTPKCPPSHST